MPLPMARVYFFSYRRLKRVTVSVLHPLLLKKMWDISRELQENQTGQLSAFSLCKPRGE